MDSCIIALWNSNNRVVDRNYFDLENIIKNSDVIIISKNGDLVSDYLLKCN